MKILIPWMLSGLAALASAAPAQEPEAERPAPSAAALARIDEIGVEADAIVEKWREEWAAQQKAHAEAVRKAEEAGEPAPAFEMTSYGPDFSALIEKLVGWANETSGEDAALYLARAVEFGDLEEDSPGRAALDRLVKDHAASPSWARLGRQLQYMRFTVGEERAAEILGVLRENPDGDVRGWVALVDNAQTIETAEIGSEEYARAKAAVLAAAEEASDKELREELAGSIELREKFGVGATAPDITGVDLDGVAFKLSDYKGKVLFVDFWGDW